MSLRSSEQTVKGLGDKQVKKISSQARGKGFEETFRQVLKGMVNTHPLAFVRLYDTRSAGAFLPEQPGDFLLTYDKVNFLVECKSSKRYSSLSQGRQPLTSLFSDGQIASMYVWQRAGSRPLILFLPAEGEEVEFWRGEDVYEAYHTPRGKLQEKDILCRGPLNVKSLLTVFRTLCNN